MNTREICLWLAAVEDDLWRMTAGVFRFVFHGLWEWIYRMLLEIVGPVVVRMIRVTLALGLWLTVWMGPGVVAIAVIRVGAWGYVAAIAWVTLATAGSAWGLCYLKKRRARAAAVIGAGVAPPQEVGPYRMATAR